MDKELLDKFFKFKYQQETSHRTNANIHFVIISRKLEDVGSDKPQITYRVRQVTPTAMAHATDVYEAELVELKEEKGHAKN